MVFGGEDIGVRWQGEFDEGVVFAVAEDDADGGEFVGQFHVAVEVVHIHLHLAEVLMGELVALEVDEDVAAEQAVVEDEVDEEVVIVEGEALLAGLEEEALPEFEEEGFQLVDDGGLQILFGIVRLLGEAEELQDERVLDEIGGFFHDLALGGEAADFFLVPGKGEALVEGGGDLALEFADRPLVGGGFDLVEAALGGVGQREEFDVVGPAEFEGAGKFPQDFRAGQGEPWAFFRFPRQCLGFH